MTYEEIDKQFEWRNKLDYFVHGWLEEHDIEMNGEAYEKLEEAVGDIIYPIYDQAKAEQREEILEMIKKAKGVTVFGDYLEYAIDRDDIAVEIRGKV